MTLAQLEASILALPVPRDAAAFPAYRQTCRDLEAEYSASLMEPMELDDDWSRDCRDLVALSEPAGPVHESPEWDEHFARAARIEASYA